MLYISHSIEEKKEGQTSRLKIFFGRKELSRVYMQIKQITLLGWAMMPCTIIISIMPETRKLGFFDFCSKIYPGLLVSKHHKIWADKYGLKEVVSWP